MTGTIYGIGLGPGDQELMSVKTDRLLRNAKHLAFFRKAGRKGQARQNGGGQQRLLYTADTDADYRRDSKGGRQKKGKKKTRGPKK